MKPLPDRFDITLDDSTRRALSSFPFLAIAKAHRVPYGAVVRIAEAMPLLVRGRGRDMDDQTGADFDLYRHPLLINDIAAAIVDERERRERVQAGLHV